MRVFFILLITTLLSSLCYSDIINVPGDFEDIQVAVNDCEDGDTVLVAPGEYPANLLIDNRNITLASRFLMTGNRDFIEQTILDGGSRSQVINLTGENNQSLLCGMTIRNGRALERRQGSGVDIRDGASPVLRALIIRDNQNGNGAVWCHGVQDVVWDDLRIVNNSEGQYCSGLLILESIVTVNDALFQGNEAGLAGAIFLHGGAESILTLNHCEFDGNSAASSGVAEVQPGCTLNLNYCYAHDNSSRGQFEWFRTSSSVINANYCLFEGGNDEDDSAIRTIDVPPQNSQIVNCTFIGFGRYAIWCQEGGVQVNNCILWGNGIQQDGLQVDGDVDVAFSLVENMGGGGILNEDPLFVNPGEGDYHLTEDSPCIDTGDPDSPENSDGTRADMGAFYFHQRDIDVDNVNLTFEPIAWESVDSLLVSISNTGGNDLHITNILLPLHLHFFLFDEEVPFGEPITIPPDSTFRWWIFFNPQREGEGMASFQTSFLIESDDPDEPEIEVSVEGSVLSIRDEQVSPTTFTLFPAFPNPFNSITSIEYALPYASEVTLSLYNLSGQRVETMVDGRMQAGAHRAILHAGDMASGLYFVKLEGVGKSLTQKIMLVK
ncbi:MAG: T9SS type A sorting domain-containing protein [Calditrichaeota bacterium]|nr:T9SS type A sorting domain-containing protein [Calditrichota bacterium]